MAAVRIRDGILGGELEAKDADPWLLKLTSRPPPLPWFAAASVWPESTGESIRVSRETRSKGTVFSARAELPARWKHPSEERFGTQFPLTLRRQYAPHERDEGELLCYSRVLNGIANRRIETI
jgi:hypothetical protein